MTKKQETPLADEPPIEESAQTPDETQAAPEPTEATNSFADVPAVLQDSIAASEETVPQNELQDHIRAQQIEAAIVSGVDSTVLARRLRVNRVYQGAKTSEQAIITGVYYEDDPFLFGLATWLVDNAYAEWVV